MRLPQIEWKSISPIAFFSWLGFYVVLLIYLAAHSSELTWLDNVHLPIHEAGHLLFGWFGATLGLWGGTILQLLVPAALAITFVVRRELPGTTFCAVGFFHSLTGVATYMIDALRRELPLVTVGAWLPAALLALELLVERRTYARFVFAVVSSVAVGAFPIPTR